MRERSVSSGFLEQLPEPYVQAVLGLGARMCSLDVRMFPMVPSIRDGFRMPCSCSFLVAAMPS